MPVYSRRHLPVYSLLAANVAVWGAYTVYSNDLRVNRWFNRNCVLSRSRFERRPWTLATHMFMHVSGLHLLVNAFTLHSFGTALLDWMPARRFLALYFAGGVAGGVAQLTFNQIVPNTRFPASVSTRRDGAAMGASSAVTAVAAFVMRVFPYGETALIILPVQNRILLPAFFLGSAYFALFSTDTHLAHAAHIGGGLVGVAAASLYTRRFPMRR